MGNLSAADLARLVALEKAATPGEWTSIGGGGVQMDGFRDSYRIEAPHDGERWPRVCELRSGADRSAAFNNAEFIVSLRNAAPSLLAEVGRLREVEKEAAWLCSGLPDGAVVSTATLAVRMRPLRAALSGSPEVPDER